VSLDSHVVVFGASGFIGRHICQELAARNYQVTGYSSKQCDLLDTSAVKAVVSAWPADTAVVFCSAIRRTDDDSFGAFTKNVAMVHNFVEAVAGVRLRSCVFFSSVDVYGRPPPRLPVTEQSSISPTEYYGVAKIADEMFLRIRLAPTCPLTVLRIPGIYGPTDQFRSVVGTLIHRVHTDEPVYLSGTGAALRDFVEVSDVARIVSQLLQNPFSGVLNVATGRSIAIRDVVTLAARALGRSPDVRLQPDVDSKGDLVFDTRQLQRVCPELSMTSIEDGIHAYAARLA
jgi:UDP-glucose 4-epimerase